ncbi:hypothetical protein AVEN_123690-1 [Araneus ventricosus]|uniref:Thyroglobulin type-1 domain-containing protein n=1 Tax=Araneus ventricosus TaxID=182803 RepID=A0A4Y2HGK0_ARAVE|nr:hypothetical protein AVEN_123690-1 [Araneus ventricosus]
MVLGTIFPAIQYKSKEAVVHRFQDEVFLLSSPAHSSELTPDFRLISASRRLAPAGTTIAGPSRTLTTCDCYVDRETELTKFRIGIVDLDIPICNEEGTYAPVRCNIWKGKCWCSDEKGNKTSDPIQGTPRC